MDAEPQAERSEVTSLSGPGELDFSGTSASLCQISCRKSLIPRGRSKHVSGVVLETTDNYAHSSPDSFVHLRGCIRSQVLHFSKGYHQPPPPTSSTQGPGITLLNLPLTLTSNYFRPAQPLTRPDTPQLSTQTATAQLDSHL